MPMTPPIVRPIDALALLEPGALLGGVLAQTLAESIDRAERLPAGTLLGAFRITGEIGAGGMGVVYAAERDDGEFRQSVAIKCIDRRTGDAGHALFLRERQILADLRHPHIARLLDGGRHADGRLWFAMERVEGQRIDVHARTARLAVPARIDLLLQVVDAVAFAHERLLLHRDIKPANVLVDADGRAKLLDFGIAALTGDGAAQGAYSLAWASPEQRAGGDVGPASDQYQLGLLLDALLREAAPADAAEGGDESTRATTTIAAGEAGADRPRQPDAARWQRMPRARAAELAAIATRATAADPGRRYASVREFGADLQRWRDLRPVLAVGGGLGYAARSSVRRHPWTSAALASALAVLVAVVGGASLRLAAERDRAQAAAARAEREAATSQAINQFLREDLIRAADPYGENVRDAPIGELIEQAIPRVAQRLADQPEVAGEVYAALGGTLLNLGRHAPAARALDLAVADLARARGAGDERVLRARLERAAVDEAAARYPEYLAALDALRADALPLGESGALLVEIDRARAWQAYIVGDFPRALDGFAAVRARATGNPAVDDYERSMIEAGLSLSLSRLSRFDEALAAALETRRLRGAALGADNPETLASGFQIATALVGLERIEEAVATLSDLHARFKAHFGPRHSQAIIAAHELGVNLGRLERFAQAVGPLAEAAEAKIAVFGTANGNTMNSMAQLALVQLRSGDTVAAAKTVDAIWSGGYVARNDYDRRSEANLRRMIGELALARGDAAGAARECTTAREGAERYFPAGHFAHVQVEACLALAAAAQAPGDASRTRLQAIRAKLAGRPHTGYWLSRIDAALAGT
jgi:serine/threonine-protein kinase